GQAGVPGTCVPLAGTPCGEGQTCQVGVVQPRGSCNSSGVCEPAPPVSCAPYRLCAGNACATSCVTNNDCVDDAFCLSGQCVGDGANGDPCQHGGQCASGHCVAGVC